MVQGKGKKKVVEEYDENEDTSFGPRNQKEFNKGKKPAAPPRPAGPGTKPQAQTEEQRKA